MAKANQVDPRRRAIDQAHHRQRDAPSFVQRSVNAGYRISTAFRRAIQRLKTNERRVRFAPLPKVATFSASENATLVTYDSGANGHYLSEADRKQAGLPILRQSTKHVGVVNGGTSSGKFVTQLRIPGLSQQASEADTFDDFSAPLLSVGKTADDDNIFYFYKG